MAIQFIGQHPKFPPGHIMSDSGQPNYSTLHFIVKHGDWIAAVVGAAPLVIGLIAAVMLSSILAAIAGLAGSAFLYLVMRSYVELVRVIVDMLLPK